MEYDVPFFTGKGAEEAEDQPPGVVERRREPDHRRPERLLRQAEEQPRPGVVPTQDALPGPPSLAVATSGSTTIGTASICFAALTGVRKVRPLQLLAPSLWTNP